MAKTERTPWQYAVRRVDLPAGRYEPRPALGTFATLDAATEAAKSAAAEAANCYTPRIYEVRTRGRKLLAQMRVGRG
jgi:hypothetical protein